MLDTGDRVRVHHNLHNGKCSVVDPASGRVIAHVDTVTLRDVEFRVQPAGRARTVASGQRSVHAYAIGHLVTTDAQDVAELTRVTYNPHRAAHFHVQGVPAHKVTHAERVTFGGGYCYAHNASD